LSTRSRSSAGADDTQEHGLLQELLLTPPGSGDRPLRPVALRSRAEQRRLALRSFLQRTWFDRLLFYSERALLLAVALVFGYWLIDGYGRDWLHELRQGDAVAAPIAARAMPSPVLAPTTRPTAAEPAAPDTQAAALPFTTPDMALPSEAPDYLAPGSLAAPAPPSDLRPQWLSAPDAAIDTPVAEVFVQDGAWQVADYAAGYHHGSALPGSPGNTVMAGHAGLRGAVFRDLGALAPGSEVFVVAGGWRYRYRVREVKSVWPNQVEVIAPTPTPVLTLITCTAWDTQRLVVVADLVDSLPVG
jgi:sortase A